MKVELKAVEGGFEVIAVVSSAIWAKSNDLKKRVNIATGSFVHTCVFKHKNTVLRFSSSGIIPWDEVKAEVVRTFIEVCVPTMERDIQEKKRKRQVRDALNKCADSKLVEKIANLLKV